MSNEELAKAFQAEEITEVDEPREKLKHPSKIEKKSGKFTASIVIFAVGLCVLAGGLVFLVLKLTAGPAVSDAEFLISAKEWMLDEETNCISEEPEAETNCIGDSGVIWKFTEAGKGTLTTNNHTNDYDFIWATDNGTLKVETDWLYTLNNEYQYELNRGEGVLTLKDEDKAYRFLMVKEETE